jgi:hypothetical protein
MCNVQLDETAEEYLAGATKFITETPKIHVAQGHRAASPRLSTCTVHRPIPARANPITLDSSRSGSRLDRPGSTNVTRGRKSATGECIEIHHTLTAAGE